MIESIFCDTVKMVGKYQTTGRVVKGESSRKTPFGLLVRRTIKISDYFGHIRYM
jgi:hypothetical protein